MITGFAIMGGLVILLGGLVLLGWKLDEYKYGKNCERHPSVIVDRINKGELKLVPVKNDKEDLKI